MLVRAQEIAASETIGAVESPAPASEVVIIIAVHPGSAMGFAAHPIYAKP